MLGAAWGVAPSTAAVQGYLLIHGEPRTEAEIRTALDFSPRTVRLALGECEAWGIIERAPEPRRSGRRGPAGTAWQAVEDHWEWFRRVAEARKRLETDPVLPLLRDCLEAAEQSAREDPAAAALRDRAAGLYEFVLLFDQSVSAIVRARASALGKLVGTAGRLEPAVIDRLLTVLAEVPDDELAAGATALSRLSSTNLRRLLRLASQPGLRRLVGA